MPLSTIRTGPDTDPWSPSDRMLAVALTLHEQSIASCGHHVDAYGDAGGWVAETTICGACAAIEEYQAGQDREHPTPGEKVIAVRETGVPTAPGEVAPVFD